MKLFSSWRSARATESREIREAKEKREAEARDSIAQRWHDSFKSCEAVGFVRACTNLHWAPDYNAAGGYVLTPTKKLVLMVVHRGGAVHFSDITT